jgi:hypothetical protein
MPFPKSERTAIKRIQKVHDMEEQVGQLLLNIDKEKEEIGKYMDENGLKVLQCKKDESNSIMLVAKISGRATINYDVNKLREKLDKEMFLEVTKRTYEITDINAMIALMKSAGIGAKAFKNLISTIIKPDNAKIKFLYDNGELKMKQLKGCFSAKISKSVKITEETGGQD